MRGGGIQSSSRARRSSSHVEKLLLQHNSISMKGRLRKPPGGRERGGGSGGCGILRRSKEL